jgi:hypothetical protein
MFDLRTSMGFSLSWNLLPLTPVWVCVCAMMERRDEVKCQEIEGERILVTRIFALMAAKRYVLSKLQLSRNRNQDRLS